MITEINKHFRACEVIYNRGRGDRRTYTREGNLVGEVRGHRAEMGRLSGFPPTKVFLA